MRVLFLLNRWLANSDMPSSAIVSLLESFDEAGPGARDVVYVDELWRADPAEAGLRMVAAASQTQPDAIVIAPIPALPRLHLNPRIELLHLLRQVRPTRVVLAAFDGADPTAATLLAPYAAVCDRFLCIDGDGTLLRRSTRGTDIVDLWAPAPARYFHPGDGERDVNVAFVGTRGHMVERAEAIAALRARGVEIHVDGGEREGGLSFDAYGALLRRAKINVNFCRNGVGATQIKARVFESIASGCVLLEQENPITARYFRAGRDYVPFRDVADLAEKIPPLLDDAARRSDIVRNALETYGKYAPRAFWARALAP